ncbi:MAG: ABC transporter ATP-binding protein [Bdellovibrionales bacterium]|nr:ABC transporter ATP-binding protein [Bdellovibrionales bacterium]
MSEVQKQAPIVCESVKRFYQQGDVTVKALAGVTLTIESGEFVSLSGPSGSGKTTLLNCVAGLDIPTSGEVYLIGNRVSQMSKSQLADLRLRSVGFVFQSYNLVPVLSAQENVEFVMELQGISRTERAERARAILQEVGLAGMEHRRPAELSGGQQQRVAVARAVASRPQLVLADEPTANLDSKTSGALMDMMREMNAEHGITFVFSTHDKLVMSRARRLIKMHDGLIESDEIQS